MTLSNGWPPFYPERNSSAAVDPSQLYLGYAAVAILIGLLLVLPGVRGKERIFFLLRWSTSLFVGASIIACVQGMSWHVGRVDAVMPYRVNGEEMARFKVGLMIGLTSFNVTLRGESGQVGDGNFLFSEQFYFLRSDVAMNDALTVGLPFPILNVLEHFSVNRISSIWMWGRRYWVAGHYGFYLLWSAFGSWIIANVLFHAVLRYGGLMLAFTGLLMVGANLSYVSIGSHGCHLGIHLGYYENAILRPTYGWSFWLCLGVGLFCILCGSFIFLADHVCVKSLRRFFSLNREEDGELLECEVHGYRHRRSDSYPNISYQSRRSSESATDAEYNNYAFQSTDEESPAATHRQPSQDSDSSQVQTQAVVETSFAQSTEMSEAGSNQIPLDTTSTLTANRLSQVSFKLQSIPTKQTINTNINNNTPLPGENYDVRL